MQEANPETVVAMLEESGQFENVDEHRFFVAGSPTNDKWMQTETDVIAEIARKGWIVADISGSGRIAFERYSKVE